MSSGSDIGLKMGYLLVSLIGIYVGAPLVESLGALDESMDDTIKAHYAEHKNDTLFFFTQQRRYGRSIIPRSFHPPGECLCVVLGTSTDAMVSKG